MNMHYLTPSIVIGLGATCLAIQMIHQELSEKLWKCLGIGVIAGVIGFGLLTLTLGAK